MTGLVRSCDTALARDNRVAGEGISGAPFGKGRV
jgi:hypothetical protein